MNCDLHIAVCDDEKTDRDILTKMIKKFTKNIQCSEFNSAKKLLDDFYPDKYDLIIMDICMADMSGIEAVAAIRKIDDNVLVAFSTASLDYTLESYRLGVIKYLEKPINIKPLRELLEFSLIKKKNSVCINIIANRIKYDIPVSKIIYIEQKSHNLLLYLNNGQTIQTKGRLDSFLDYLPNRLFFKSHKSYVVNLSYVKSINKELMVFNMYGGNNAYICRQNLSAAKMAYEKYLFESMRGYNKI